MIMQAVYQGKILNYPLGATFIIERRPSRRRKPLPLSMVATKNTIEGAITKFDRTRCAEQETVLSAAFNGRIRPVIRVKS